MLPVGAQRRTVSWLIVRETLLLIGIGVALGLPLVFAGARQIEGLLFGIGPRDPVALSGAVLVLFTVGSAAAWLPARRASRIDPMVVLRQE